MTEQAVHEPEANRYVIRLEGISEPAFLQYNIEELPNGKAYNLTHTYVTPAMRGKGIAAKLVQKAITHAREDDHKIIPTCSYIAAYMQRHEQDKDVVYEE